MKIVIDMNLSPDLAPLLKEAGHATIHWSSIGDPRAEDRTILAWALSHGHIVLTHDLDFGAILAATNATAPSVIQVRTQNVLPAALTPLLIRALKQFEDLLTAGALIILHEDRAKARIFPLRRAAPDG